MLLVDDPIPAPGRGWARTSQMVYLKLDQITPPRSRKKKNSQFWDKGTQQKNDK